MILTQTRIVYALIVIAVTAMMSYGLYTQHYQGLEPCPLCMSQRFFYCLIGLFAAIGWVLNSKRNNVNGALGVAIVISAIGGIALAGRQVWLQHLPPDQVPACGPSLEYMLESFPFSETITMLMMGDGNCAEVVWQFLGLSMGEWSLINFIGFLVVSVWHTIRSFSSKA